jgi:hypothetical protein
MLVSDDGWAEALDRFVSDGTLRKRLGTAAGAWAKQQTIANHVDEWEAVLQDAVAQTHAARP